MQSDMIRRLHEAVKRSAAKRMERDQRIKDLERENAELRSRLQALLAQPGPAGKATGTGSDLG
jgi:hypothetical protein